MLFQSSNEPTLLLFVGGKWGKDFKSIEISKF